MSVGATLVQYSGLIAFIGIFALGIVIRWVRVLGAAKGEPRATAIYRAIRRMISVALFFIAVLLIGGGLAGGMSHLVELGLTMPGYVRVVLLIALGLQVAALGLVVARVVRIRAAWAAKASADAASHLGSEDPTHPAHSAP